MLPRLPLDAVAALWLAAIGSLLWVWQVTATARPRPAPRVRSPLEVGCAVVDGDEGVSGIVAIARPGRPARVAVRVVAAGGPLFADVAAPWSIPWADWSATGDPLIRELAPGRPVDVTVVTATVTVGPQGVRWVQVVLYTDRGIVRRCAPIGRAGVDAHTAGWLDVEVWDLVEGSRNVRRLELDLLADDTGLRPATAETPATHL